MSRRLKQAALVLVVIVAGAQLIRPDRTNPPVVASRTIRAHLPTDSPLPAIVDRSCRDCHSNETVWPWYTNVAPVSWLMANGVATGRTAVNFSEWDGYAPDRREFLLTSSCQDVSAGKMPGPWTWIHPETRLSAADIETFCSAARQASAREAKP